MDISGAKVVVLGAPLHPACASDGEVDLHIKQLKEHLDGLSGDLKRALGEQAKNPLFSGNSDPYINR